MLRPVTVVVPTYWTRPGAILRPGDALYDHPTPVDGPSTLGRLLDSLAALDVRQFSVVVLVAVTAEDAEVPALRRVQNIVHARPSLHALAVGADDVSFLVASLAGRMPDAQGMLGLRTYPLVRNLQLAVPCALGAQVIIALDDDEAVTDPAFIDRALEGLGTEVQGHRVDGTGGYYEQGSNGGILLHTTSEARTATNLFDRKPTIMNEATEQLERETGRLVLTPFCFGGNMVFPRDLACAVGFDPRITRGEDIDYLINARMEGHWFYMNKDLRVLHLPPPGGSYQDIAVTKVLQDVVRFVYERAKIDASQSAPELSSVTSEELWPYPGEFLMEGLDNDALEILERVWSDDTCAAASAMLDATSPQEVLSRAHVYAQEGVTEYLTFRERWPELMRVIAADALIPPYFSSRDTGASIIAGRFDER